ncbi:DUF3888 domain-containing protein [Lihuaxuella thermophila]|uniref:DUF3888 domain-containing protein n=1 Tax=Lihuaxuella thermophila TaxID=1173111 RepID=A0A1H8G7U0_9BACL|nr:DUF3888 domain-containing protein [Lihuaxuella thermophila]SEN39577.1 Protein of unknown function [Lihuaxuella thermophila]
MKKIAMTVFLSTAMILTLPISSHAGHANHQPQESKELLYQDMLMLFLLPHIDQAVHDFYAKQLTASPVVYPYQVEVKKAERVGGSRSFHFLITLETTPVVGPHIPVGTDRLRFEIDPTLPGQVKLIQFEHLKSHELPPRWRHMIRRPEAIR